MRLSVASAALAAAFVLLPVAAGTAPALAEDFSITNQEPADPFRRDLMQQLQAWWDLHAYYPKEASQADVGGTVKVHLVILPDGVIFTHYVVESSQSRSIDTAAFAAFDGGFVRPFPAGPNAQRVELDISLHYILSHRHDQPVPAGYTPVASRSPFTITNDPVKSSVVDTVSQRTCTGTIVRHGIRNHPVYGYRHTATAIFFRKPDGTPWVKYREVGPLLGALVIAPVTEVGKVLKWTGQEERHGFLGSSYAMFTVWPEGENRLIGKMDYPWGTVEFTCATDIVPPITSSAWVEFAEPKLAPDPETLHYRPGTPAPSYKYP